MRIWDQAPTCAAQAGEYPLASPLAHWQARRGNVVFTRRHKAVRLNDFQTLLLARLDGTHDRVVLRKQMWEDSQQGKFTVQEDSPESPVTEDRIGELVDATLNELAKQALIIR